MIYFHNVSLYTPEGKIDHGVLLTRGETIIAMGEAHDIPFQADARFIDGGGASLVPGFIDLQINGAFGMDFTSEPETIWQVGERLLCFGVTSFLPTIVTSPLETIRKAQVVIQKGPPANYHGARVIGLHLEGPYLNPQKRGAHNPAYLCLPDPEVYHRWSPQNSIRLVTIAPELPGAIEAIHTLVNHGVVVSAGHTQATTDQATSGIEAGIRYGTHLFNAMPPLDHHQPGLAGALLGDPRLIAGMIVDGIHLHPTMVNFAWNTLGTQRTSLVTDAMAALGMPAGEYQLGGRTVYVDGASARLQDGRLAGSLLTLDQALRNLIAFTGCSLDQALPTVTQVPAQLLGLNNSLGCITQGNKADLVMLSPDLQVIGVWINGRQILPASG